MAEEKTPPPGLIQIPLAWVDADERVVALANQFLFQRTGSAEFVLTIGQALPPPLIGTPEEQLEQAQRLTYVGVHALGRFAMSRDKVDDLIRVLQSVLETADAETQTEPPDKS